MSGAIFPLKRPPTSARRAAASAGFCGRLPAFFFGGWQVPYLQATGFVFPWGGTVALPHLAVVALAKAAQIDLFHIPLKGEADALTSVLGGHISLFVSHPTFLTAHAEKLRGGAQVTFANTVGAVDDILYPANLTANRLYLIKETSSNAAVREASLMISFLPVKSLLSPNNHTTGSSSRVVRRPGTQSPNCQTTGVPMRVYQRFCPRFTCWLLSYSPMGSTTSMSTSSEKPGW